MDKFKLVRSNFDKDNVVSYGNMFLIGNGHLGYRGTLEEFNKSEMVGLNVVGLYDRYKKLWRESINMPNPFKVILSNDSYLYSVLENKPIEHSQSLDLKHAVFSRHTEYEEIIIDSERFIPITKQNLLLFKYTITAKCDTKFHVSLGTDDDIYEINGPHFKSKKILHRGRKIEFRGKTNEQKNVSEVNQYYFNNQDFEYDNGMFDFDVELKQNETYEIICYSTILENENDEAQNYTLAQYKKIKDLHFKDLESRWDKAYIEIGGNDEVQFYSNYSIYHLLILGNENYETSIPARGVSGEVYKGAIFWDSEIFLVPFFTLTNPKIARSLLKYRINTLSGAMAKAREFGYDGAFYAWESQDTGLEACSKYNVTDPETGNPIRTYFNEKQIHICADIVYAFSNYVEITKDYSILEEGGLDVMIQVSKFFISYAKLVMGKYRFIDCIGPDEYHERVDDEAFTSYMAKFAINECIKHLDEGLQKESFKEFVDHLFVPLPNESKLIEQFRGYFKKEDVDVDTVRSRLVHENDYWGSKNGVATPTRVIKQADVIALLVLLNKEFDKETMKANFDFYYPYTEHGSSLSSSMYSIVASIIGYTDKAYDMFIKSASIDLSKDQKMWAGGIYIGGTHPASNAGSYLSIIFGFAGLRFNEDSFTLSPNLPDDIESLKFKFIFNNKVQNVCINKDNSYSIKEENL